MIQRVVLAVVALAAMAAAAGVVVVSLAFAVYTFLREYLGPPGAAAVIAAAFAVLLAIGAMVFFGRAKHPTPKKPIHPPTIADRVGDVLRERPVAAAGAAVAAGLIAWRNPALVTALMRLMEPRPDRERI